MAVKKPTPGQWFKRPDNPVRDYVMSSENVRATNRAIAAAMCAGRGEDSPTLHILVADDDLDGLESTSRALGQEGFEVFVAADGKSAIRLAEATRANLVILNITMPEASGLEVISTLRPRYPEMKFIAVAGPGEPQCNVNAATRFGAVTVLAKPFDGRTLLGSVRVALGALDRSS